MRFTRITVDPGQMGGVPCLRGLRIPVATVVAMLADGMTEVEILAAYPDLQREDIAEALQYAAEAVRERRHSTSSAITSLGYCVRFSKPPLRSLNCFVQSRQQNRR
jgi:uncharacterized protein (DUF433 family)